MITGKEKVLWILYGTVLLVLFLLSSTDLIIKEKEGEIYSVSVVVEKTADDDYVNFRKGAERAAIELNADVSFITLYEEGNQKQQTELLLREQQDGSRALIVSPVDQEAVARLLSEKRVTVPMVLLNSEIPSTGDGATARIAFDYYAMGRQLGEQVLTEQPPGQMVYLIGRQVADMVSQRFLDGILSVIVPSGRCLVSRQQKGKEGWKAFVEGLGRPGGQVAGEVVIALDPGSLAEVAQLLAEDQAHASYVDGLYGRGTTVRILNYLDKGVINGLCITDDFSAGYLSVKTAVELSGNQVPADMGYLESHYIKKEDLRKEDYEKLLYPIE